MRELSRQLFNKKSANHVHDKLGVLIDDVRGHIRQNAEGLLGPESKRHNSSEIHVPGTASAAWKNHPEEQTHHQYPLPS